MGRREGGGVRDGWLTLLCGFEEQGLEQRSSRVAGPNCPLLLLPYSRRRIYEHLGRERGGGSRKGIIAGGGLHGRMAQDFGNGIPEMASLQSLIMHKRGRGGQWVAGRGGSPHFVSLSLRPFNNVPLLCGLAFSVPAFLEKSVASV